MKERRDMFSENNADHPVRCDRNGSLKLFLNLNLLGQVWEPTDDNNGCLAQSETLQSQF